MMTNWRYLKYTSNLFLLGLLCGGCFQSDYTRLVKSELAKGIRVDSVLLGINFGDARQEFFGKCFDLNKQHLVTQGPTGLSVQYLFSDSSVHKKPMQIRLLFSPSFDQKELISDIDLEFSYVAWAPWNKQLQSDSLKIKVEELLMQWYGGNEFIKVKVDDAEVPVKLDGNRRLLVHIKDTQSVVVEVQDILHPKFRHSISPDKNKESAEK